MKKILINLFPWIMRSIALFDKEYKILAVVDVESKNFRTEIFDRTVEKKLSSIIDSLDLNKLSISREIFDADSNSLLIDQLVASDDPRVIEAVAQALKPHFFIVSLFENSLKEYFLLTRDESLDSTTRRDLVVTLVNIAPNDAVQLEEALSTIKPIFDSLRKNREEWKKTLDQKTDEILGNS